MPRRCCARCKTPYMCGNTECGCHVGPGRESCGFCGVDLFIPPPNETVVLLRNLFTEIRRAA